MRNIEKQKTIIVASTKEKLFCSYRKICTACHSTIANLNACFAPENIACRQYHRRREPVHRNNACTSFARNTRALGGSRRRNDNEQDHYFTERCFDENWFDYHDVSISVYFIYMCISTKKNYKHDTRRYTAIRLNGKTLCRNSRCPVR